LSILLPSSIAFATDEAVTMPINPMLLCQQCNQNTTPPNSRCWTTVNGKKDVSTCVSDTVVDSIICGDDGRTTVTTTPCDHNWTCKDGACSQGTTSQKIFPTKNFGRWFPPIDITKLTVPTDTVKRPVLNHSFGHLPMMITEPTCNDTDGGQNEDTTGTVYGKTLGGESYSKTDFCDFLDVIEYYCDEHKAPQSTAITCDDDQTCKDGHCVHADYRRNCDDSDGGENVFEKGTVRGNFNSGTTYSYTDECVDGDTIREFFCADDHTPTDYKIDCGDHQVCKEGACVTDPMANCICNLTSTMVQLNCTGEVPYEHPRYLCHTGHDSQNWRREYGCDGNHHLTATEQRCSSCSNGVCVP
jgi:hypothetical protein